MYCISKDRNLWEVKGAWSLEWRGLVSSSWTHTQYVHLEILIFDDTLLKELLRSVEGLLGTNGYGVTWRTSVPPT
jgi:hypothetical protein